MRQLVDESGVITLTKSYEPYGEILSSAGRGASTYGYTGEMQDVSTGLVYLRARYYAYGDARFINRDTCRGDYAMPMSYNAWLYEYANPVTNTDPTGLEPCRNDSRYCLLTGEWNGAFIDVFHWRAAMKTKCFLLTVACICILAVPHN